MSSKPNLEGLLLPQTQEASPVTGSAQWQGVNSTTKIIFYSFLTGFSVVLVSLMLQWLIYRDWLHESGPIRIIGSAMAACVTFAFVYHWQVGIRERHREMLRRFEAIAEMNDLIRNGLQAIELLLYKADQDSMQPLREAVDKIDAALRGVVADSHLAVSSDLKKKRMAKAGGGQRNGPNAPRVDSKRLHD